MESRPHVPPWDGDNRFFAIVARCHRFLFFYFPLTEWFLTRLAVFSPLSPIAVMTAAKSHTSVIATRRTAVL
jgi:hypothetical protein